ncbi:hypothetical protein PG984_006542 [Apiospora sp. TS-2023a]
MALRDIRKSIGTAGDATKALARVSQISGKAEPLTPSQEAQRSSASDQQQGVGLEAYAKAVIVADPMQDSLTKRVPLHGNANTPPGTSDISGRRMSCEEATYRERWIATNPALSQALREATNPSSLAGEE